MEFPVKEKYRCSFEISWVAYLQTWCAALQDWFYFLAREVFLLREIETSFGYDFCEVSIGLIY